MNKPGSCKLRSNFPLTLYPTGHWCKRIRGKLYYLGTDKQAAYERYLNEAAQLHADRPRACTLEIRGL